MPIRKPIFLISVCLLCVFLFVKQASAAYMATTTLVISVCGDAIVNPPAEVCDDGTNTGGYSFSAETKHCNPDCQGYGPYCGDSILQMQYGEQCDDGNNIDKDRCSSTCQVEDLKTGCCPGAGPGGGGGTYLPGSSTAPVPAKVAIFGKAYPSASVHILKDGEAVGVVMADTNGDFYFATTDVTPGVATFGFWAEDKRSIKSIAYTLTFRIVPNAVTTVSGAYLPPTISADKNKIARGEKIVFSGQSAPGVEIQTYVNSDSDIVTSTRSDTAGDWSLRFDSTPLEDDNFHTARALFITGTSTNVIKSSFSELVNFFVGRGSVIDTKNRSDINKDGHVNFVDFSILIYFWGTTNQDCDINLDGKVNLVDFSLLIYNWTG
jgi:cysteine-rich repeat protein